MRPRFKDPFHGLATTWAWIIGHFLADPDNPTDLRQTQVFIITTMVLVLIAGPFAVQYWSMKLHFMSCAVIATTILGLSSAVLFKHTKNVTLCGTIATFCVYLLLIFSNITSGGFYDPNFSWFYVVPVMGMVITNQKMGWVWTAVIAATTLTFWYLPELGINLENKIPLEDHPAQSLANRFSAIVAIAGLSSAFVISQHAAEKKLREALSLLQVEIEERKEAQEEALVAAQVKAEFLANMSHEIRTPMNAVIGMAGVLSHTPLEDKQRRFVNSIQKSGQGLLQIINDILDFSKIEAGKLEFERVDFDLNEVVSESISLVSQEAQEKKLELVSAIYSEVPTQLTGDPGRLRQVLINLLSNAVKFTSEGFVALRIKAKSTQDNAVILLCTVSDTGIGIPKDRIDTLFDPFVQGDGSTTRKFGGTGLGLAISRQIVEQMPGKIWAETRPGGGSTFSFEAHFDLVNPATAAPFHRSELKGRCVLAVDDKEVNLELLKEQLQSWQLSVICAQSGVEALQHLLSRNQDGPKIHAMLIDMQMPGMDGSALAQVVRQDAKNDDIPLLLLSSSSVVDSPSAKLFDQRLFKPVQPTELLECLCRVMSGNETTSSVIVRDVAMTFVNSPRVLVVEDNSANQLVAQMQLEHLGIQAQIVGNGQEAMDALEDCPFDIVFMDCQMPVMDGFTATKNIRKREQEKQHTIIIALTANALQKDRQQCLAAGMDDYLSKPIRLESLIKTLKKWLPKKHSFQPSPPIIEIPASDAKTVDALQNDDEAVSESFVDTAYLSSLLAASPEKLRNLVSAYKDSAENLFTRLDFALSAKEEKETRYVLHTLKGSSGGVGGRGLARQIRCLEEMPDKEIHDKRNKLSATLRSSNHRLVKLLSKLVDDV
ncbi:MAG: response regulator [Planctomycetota bacterium]|nr:response regulator [Planctomycetota bacterium]